MGSQKLTRDEMEYLRELVKEDPAFYTPPVLAEKFQISAEAVERILHSKWEPSVPRRVSQDAAKVRKNTDVAVEKVILEFKTLARAQEFFQENPYDPEMQKAIVSTCRNLIMQTSTLHKKTLRELVRQRNVQRKANETEKTHPVSTTH